MITLSYDIFFNSHLVFFKYMIIVSKRTGCVTWLQRINLKLIWVRGAKISNETREEEKSHLRLLRSKEFEFSKSLTHKNTFNLIIFLFNVSQKTGKSQSKSLQNTPTKCLGFIPTHRLLRMWILEHWGQNGHSPPLVEPCF